MKRSNKTKVGLTAALLLCAALTSCIDLGLRDADEIKLPSYDNGSSSETSAEPESTPGGSFASSGDFTNPTQDKLESDPADAPLDKVDPPADPYAGVNITFTACGDNLIHPNIYTDASYRGTAEKQYDFLPMYENVADFISSADIAFINQETVMAGEEYGYSGYPCFNAPRQLGLDMVELGFDVINIANNHMLDKGAAGLESTISFWNEQPVTLLGGYLNQNDAHTVRTIEKDGVTIAFLSYTLSTNGIVKSASSEVEIPYIDDQTILSDMEKARAIGDVLIVSMHWGDENTQTPNSEQKRLAGLIANAGADVILGHHSHTVQPIEWIEREDGGKTLCIYSLGNFVSGMARPVNQVGGFLTFTIRGNGEGGLEIAEVYFTPTVFYYGMDWYNTKLYFMKDYTAEVAATHGVAISGYTLTVEQAESFIDGIIDEEFLKEDY